MSRNYQPTALAAVIARRFPDATPEVRALAVEEIFKTCRAPTKDIPVRVPETSRPAMTEERREHLRKINSGNMANNTNLSESIVRGIRQALVDGAKVRDLAHEHDVTPDTIYKIKRRETWKDC